MPRKAEHGLCMLCDESPCVCNGPVEKKPTKKAALPKPAKRAVKTVETVIDEPRTGHMQAAAIAIKSAPLHPPLDDDIELGIRVLVGAGMLHSQEQNLYADIIQPTNKARAWKERHGLHS